MMFRRFKTVAAVLVTTVLALGISSHAETPNLDFGKFVITVSDSVTAETFHVVDMLSDWEPASTHRAYLRWTRDKRPLSDDDRQLLKRHAEMRKARGWGHGFEQAFLVDDDIDVASARAIDTGLLSADEANTEKIILQHFVPVLAPLRDQSRTSIGIFKDRLATEHDRLAPLVAKLIRFSGITDTIRVPVFLVSNSEQASGGGEANGGRIIVEVPGPDPLGMLLHESFHVLLAGRAADLRRAAEDAGLSFGVVNEAFAYALAPGLTDDAKPIDGLFENLARNVRRGTPASDSYVQAYIAAGLMRPILRLALERGDSLSDVLTQCVEKWRSFAGR
jgi:hypothetical protein